MWWREWTREDDDRRGGPHFPLPIPRNLISEPKSPMPIETRCRGCGVILELPHQHAGARVRCPACRLEMSAPAETDVQALEAVCHYCGDLALEERWVNEEFRACRLCHQSIEQNDVELQRDREARRGLRHGLYRRLWWIAAIGVIIWLAVSNMAQAARARTRIPPSRTSLSALAG